MNLHEQLQQRQAEGRPIRVGLIGAGRFGTMYLAQARNTPGLHIVAVADINLDRAREALRLAEWPDAETATDVATAARTRRLAVVDDAAELFNEHIDVIVEATGNPITGIAHAVKAIDAGQHVVMVTVEADPLAGPALRARADRANVVYTLAYGDQPAVIWELVDWARTSGFDVVCAGKGAKFLPHYHKMTPDNVWENWEFPKELTDSGQLNPRMYTAFRDGTKAAIEMAAVANATGLVPSDDGLTFTPGSQEEIASVCRPADEGGVLAHSGSVEVMSSVTRDGNWIEHNTQEGVFVVVKATNRYVADCFKDFPGCATPDGRYGALYRPYHFIGLEVNISVANAALRHVATGAPVGFYGDVVACAKRGLAAGETLDGEGGYTVWGKLVSADTSVKRNALPVALAHHVKLKHDVAEDAVVSWDDVLVDDSLQQAIALRRETEQSRPLSPTLDDPFWKVMIVRISVFPKGELDDIVAGRLTVPEWVARAADLPIEGVELYSRFFPAGEPDAVDRARDALETHQLQMPMLCASPDFTHPDRDERRRQFDEQVRMVHIAASLGGPGASCRVLSGQRHPGVDDEVGVEWVVEAFEELIPIARELDVVLGFENHYKDGFWRYPEFAQRRRLYLRILSAIDDRSHFGVQFDPSNAVTAGEDSTAFLAEVVDRVVTMQASDRHLAPGASLEALRQADGTLGYSEALRHGVIGEGVNDYPAIFDVLTRAGYDGWISVEDGVNGWHEMRASVDFLRRARREHFNGSTDIVVPHRSIG